MPDRESTSHPHALARGVLHKQTARRSAGRAELPERRSDESASTPATRRKSDVTLADCASDAYNTERSGAYRGRGSHGSAGRSLGPAGESVGGAKLSKITTISPAVSASPQLTDVTSASPGGCTSSLSPPQLTGTGSRAVRRVCPRPGPSLD